MESEVPEVFASSQMDSSGFGQFGGFKTGRGKPVKFSAEALERASSIFNHKADSCEKKQAHTSFNQEDFSGFGGFKTGSGKPVEFSAEALERGRSIFNVEADPIDKKLSQTLFNQEDFIGCGGFQTGRGKPVKFSAKALERGRSIFNDQADSSEKKQALTSFNQVDLSCFSGFKTGRGKPVEFSAEAIERGRSIFNDEADSCVKKQAQTSLTRENLSGFGGFKTGGGKLVEFSVEALERGRAIFNDEGGSIEMKQAQNSFNREDLSVFGGFKTRNGKPVEFSAEALERGRAIFNDNADSSEKKQEQASFTKEDFIGCGGFQTGRGRPVKFSAKALERGRSIFNDEADSSEKKQALTSFNRVDLSCFGGFRTGRGKPVEFSAEAIEQGRSIFNDEAGSVEKKPAQTSLNQEDLNGFRGFKTGIGKPVEFSAEALERGRAIFNVEADQSSTEMSSFQTADTIALKSPCKTPIRSSEATLKKVFKLFDASDDEDEQLSPIINFRSSCQPSTDLIDENETEENPPAYVLRNLFPNNKPTTSTPMLKNTLKRGKKLFKEFRNDSFEDNQNQSINLVPLEEENTPEPSPKRNKFDCDNYQDHNLSGFTQEVSDLTKDLLADEERSKLLAEDDSFFTCKTLTPILVEPTVLTARDNGRIAQLTEIERKRQNSIKPIEGLLLRSRNFNRKSRIKMSNNSPLSCPKYYTESELLSHNVKNSIFNINPQNALQFRFDGIEFFGKDITLTNTSGILVGDDVLLILGYDCAVGCKEIASGFMCSPGIDPKLVSSEWVYNHYKWIVWTLANYEFKFPEQFGGIALTPHNTLIRLKYRYDREIDKSERSAIHRIIEQDDTPAKRMILLVSNITGENESLEEKQEVSDNKTNEEVVSVSCLELTDGWYSIECVCDATFITFIKKGIVTIGTKLCLQGAELVASEATHPLEAKGKVMLKFGSNSVRRARWNSRLGFCDIARPFPITLNSVISDGGQISLLHVTVARVYPIIYHCKTDGKSVFYSEKYFEKIQRLKDTERERQVERLYSEVQKQVEESFSKTKRRLSSRSAMKPITKSGLENMNTEELLDLMERTNDTTSLELMLSKGKVEQIKAVRIEQQEAIRSSIQKQFELKIAETSKPEFNPVSLVKARLVDAHVRPSAVGDIKNRAQLTIWRPHEDLLKSLVEGASFRMFSVFPSTYTNNSDSEKRLTASRSTKYIPLPIQNWDIIEKIRRRCYTINSIVQEDFSPPFDEFDTIGLVAYITPYLLNQGQTVYIADEQQNLLGIKLWFAISSQGLEEILKIPNFVAVTNLNLRASSRKTCIVTAFSQESTHFTLHPKDDLFKDKLMALKSKFTQDLKMYATTCELKVVRLQESKSTNTLQPLRFMEKKTNNNNNSMLLEAYGAPPALTPIQFQVSTRLSNKFQVPRRTDSDLRS